MAIFKKIILVGDGAVGKTSLRKSFMGASFKENYMMTIGADFSVKEFPVNTIHGANILQYQIWDLAGQQSFKAVRGLYYGGTNGVLLVYDITNRTSFANVKHWLTELKNQSASPLPPVVVIANKTDLQNVADHPVEKTEAQESIRQLSSFYWGDTDGTIGIPLLETSAKTGENVDKAFYFLGQIILERMKQKTTIHSSFRKQ